MRKKTMLATAFAVALSALALSACGSDDPVSNSDDSILWGTDGGLTACNQLLFDGVIGNGDQEFVFTGKQTLPQGTYLLKGWVYVANGAELTLSPGTVIKGDKQTKAALIVEPGGKLYAPGTPQAPIVFTSAEPAGSRRPGDWGGLILCGRARNNQGTQQIEGGPRTKHGGTDDADNSGTLSYVRLEFAGYPFATDKEINALTLGSVGSGTRIDHIQVSYSNDDSYEWFGGSVNCTHLVAYRGWDDDFDTDNGYTGAVQFALSVRDPRIADKSLSNALESDNSADGAAVSPYTGCTFSNLTLLGPRAADPAFENTEGYINGGSVYPNNGSGLGKYQAAIQIRRASRLSCFNSLALGYPIGLMLDGERGDTPQSASQGLLALENLWMADMDILGSDKNKLYADVLYDWASKQEDASQPSFSTTFFRSQPGNTLHTTSDAWLLAPASGLGLPCIPQAGSPLLQAARFTHPRLSLGFRAVPYVGAFAEGDNWLEGWTNFDPQHTAY